ncbi:MAG: amidohydrolase family protein [Planctomycetes bacterium]|nr:amidohydrolase family protein [Planctomycetota bacterium]
MILDGHIHISRGKPNPGQLLERMHAAGVSGGALISLAPSCFCQPDEQAAAEERLDNLLAWTEGHAALHSLFWIDPTEPDAVDQVARAVAQGVTGFKVISNRHAPGDERAMPVYRAIAEAGRPILFHSGILWDGQPSSPFCRPAGFEALLEVPQLRFALAHIGWPWCDELIAVYGKFRMAHRTRPDLSVEMFVDTTPGTPPIYRREALTRLFGVGYDVEHNVFFGTDCVTLDYDQEWARQWISRDQEILRSLDVGHEVEQQIFAGNLQRFLGI